MCVCVCVCVGAHVRRSFGRALLQIHPRISWSGRHHFWSLVRHGSNECWGWRSWGPSWGEMIKRKVGYTPRRLPLKPSFLLLPLARYTVISFGDAVITESHFVNAQCLHEAMCNVIEWVSLADDSFVKCKYWITEAKINTFIKIWIYQIYQTAMVGLVCVTLLVWFHLPLFITYHLHYVAVVIWKAGVYHYQQADLLPGWKHVHTRAHTHTHSNASGCSLLINCPLYFCEWSHSER